MTEGTKKVTKWSAAALSVVGVIVGAIQAYGEFVEVRAEARDAEQKSVAGYATIAPTVSELQDIVSEGADWAEQADLELEALLIAKESLEDRVSRLEGFILAKHNVTLDTPPMLSAEEEPMPEPTIVVPEPRYKAVRPKSKIPHDINTAQQQVYEKELTPQ